MPPIITHFRQGPTLPTPGFQKTSKKPQLGIILEKPEPPFVAPRPPSPPPPLIVPPPDTTDTSNLIHQKEPADYISHFQ